MPLRFFVPSIFVVLFLALAAGCTRGSGNAGADTETRPGDAGDSDAIPADAGADSENTVSDGIPDIGLEAATLFGWDRVPRFDLTLPEERWAKLQRDAMAEEYVEADLIFEGETVGNVGLRFKGSWGTLDDCLDDDDGTLTCDKLSMKVRFDEYATDRRFFGLKRLDFNAMVYDHSWLHERLAYDLYRAAGVEAPRAAWAIITVNGVAYGLFSMVEQVDGRFTEDRWPDNGDGNLYKEVWPGEAVEEATLTTQLRTNEEMADHRAIQAFTEELAAADMVGPAALNETLKRWMDADYLGRLFAVEDAINASDGMTIFYTDADREWTSNHNQYTYQEEGKDFFWLIPWDLDISFWLNADTFKVPHWTTQPEDCSKIYPVYDDETFLMAPGCDLLFKALAADAAPYRRAVTALLDGPFDEATILAKIDVDAAFIRSAVAEDPFVSTEEWESRVSEIKKNIPLLRARVEALRDGMVLNPLTLDVNAINGFDDFRTIDTMIGVPVYSNGNTETVVSLVPDDSGEGGDQVLRLDFEYRDDPEPWTHYAVMYLSVASDAADVSDRMGLRFRARSDEARSVRIEMIGYAHAALDNYVYEGWDLPMTAEWNEYELLFETAALPDYATAEDLATQLPLAEILQGLQNLRVFPECLGRGDAGLIGEGQSDEGFVELEDVRFFAAVAP